MTVASVAVSQRLLIIHYPLLPVTIIAITAAVATAAAVLLNISELGADTRRVCMCVCRSSWTGICASVAVGSGVYVYRRSSVPSRLRPAGPHTGCDQVRGAAD